MATRDQVKVAMKDRLAGDSPDIDADVETFHSAVISENFVAQPSRQFVDGRRFLARQIEIRGDVAARQNERMERRDRI